jgi:enterochelin esterase-like enzyme
VRAARYLVGAAFAAAATALAAWYFHWSFEKAALLSPIVVAAVGAALGLVVLWTKVVWETFTRSRADTHPDRSG